MDAGLSLVNSGWTFCFFLENDDPDQDGSFSFVERKRKMKRRNAVAAAGAGRTTTTPPWWCNNQINPCKARAGEHSLENGGRAHFDFATAVA